MSDEGTSSVGSAEVKDNGVEGNDASPKAPQGEPTVSVEEFVKMQLELAKANKSISTMESNKVEAERLTAFAALKAINPKLAEMNKTASKDILDAVRNSVESMSKGFKKHVSEEEAPTEPTIDNHESSHYDFESGKWMYQ